MRVRVASASFVLLFCLTTVAPRHAYADGKAARVWFEKATAAYGLGDYAEAASDYEKAYAARPDPALLYNAAQSHRLAKNDARALQLYRNYLRIYADASNREETQKHIATLEAALAAPAPVPAPVVVEPVVTKPVETPPVVVVAAPTVDASLVAPAPRKKEPVYKKGWFWGVGVGSAVVVGVGLGVGLGLGLKKAPSASFGHAEAN
jgi:tetratricopeptide (TPR) repeat protein